MSRSMRYICIFLVAILGCVQGEVIAQGQILRFEIEKHSDAVNVALTIKHEGSTYAIENATLAKIDLYTKKQMKESSAETFKVNFGKSQGWMVLTLAKNKDLHAATWQTWNRSVAFQLYSSQNTRGRLLHSEELLQTSTSSFGNCTAIPVPISERDPTVYAVAEAEVEDGMAFFPGCYPQDERGHVMELGFLLDDAFFEIFGTSTENGLAEMEHILATASVIYERQLNLELRLKTVIRSPNFGGTSELELVKQSKSKRTCARYLDDSLEKLVEFSRELPESNQTAAWHLLTGCQDGGQTLGKAFVGTLARSAYNVGVNYCGRRDSSSAPFRIFAHELGHSVGASHSFEDGKTKTGGLMDYGNGYLKGIRIIGFRAERRGELCRGIQRGIKASKGELIYVKQLNSSCGNQFLESSKGEECECPHGGTSCEGCIDCRLQNRKLRCSASLFLPNPLQKDGKDDGGILASPECCLPDGQFAAPTTQCTNGYCVSGRCVNSCSVYLLDVCPPINQGCTQQCLLPNNVCKPQGKNSAFSTLLPDGVSCTISESQGTCIKGSCILTTPFPTAEHSPTWNPTWSPTDVPTIEPTSRPTNGPSQFSTPSATPSFKPTSVNSTTELASRESEGGPSSSTTAAITGVASGIGVLCAGAILGTVVYLRRQKRAQNPSEISAIVMAQPHAFVARNPM